MREKIQDGTISKEQMDKVIALDDMMTANGLQQYLQVGKTLRAELGYGGGSTEKTTSRKSSGRKSGSRGGTKATASKFNTSQLFGFGSPATSTNRSLRALLDSLT
jgi:hypothetical protein